MAVATLVFANICVLDVYPRIGFIFTVYAVFHCFDHYRSFPRMITHKKGSQGNILNRQKSRVPLFVYFYKGITFPKILVCSHSMHSVERLQVNFPQINFTILKAFYGSYGVLNGVAKDYWTEIVMKGRFKEMLTNADVNNTLSEFNSIDLNHFYKLTRPKLLVIKI